MDYLEMLGMPADVCQGLEMDHLTQVLEFLISKKK
jgi:hypothetical protein